MRKRLKRLTLRQTAKNLQEGTLSATELAEHFLEKIQADVFNAFITVHPEILLEQAKEADLRIKRQENRPLEGLPIAIKDNICTKDVRMTAASRILDTFAPPYEATVTERLWNAGALLLGKTNLDEFAMGSTTATSAFGPTKNPWHSLKAPKQDLVPGGSSGGSAAAVSGELALAALGTDTGGSIRQPAAFCGITGIKPTYGRCSRFGIVPLASSLDQVGPMTHSVEDAAWLLEFMAGHDEKDATTSAQSVPKYTRAVGQSIKGLRIGIPEEYRTNDMDSALQSFWEQGAEWLKEAGAEIKKVSLPHTHCAVKTYTVICGAEASSNLARFDGVRYGLRASEKNLHDLYTKTRDAGFGTEVKRRILMGTYLTSKSSHEAYFEKAQKVRRLIYNDFVNTFHDVDVILTPTAPTGAFPLNKIPNDPTTLYLNDVFTVPINLAGLPAISVPAALNAEGLPLSLQLVGRAFDEETLFKTAAVLEKCAVFPRAGWEDK